VDIVIPTDGVGAIEMAMPDRISQLDVSHISDHRLVVRLELWAVPARSEES